MSSIADSSKSEVKEDKEKSGVELLVAIIGGCATIIGFWTSYGWVALGALIAICSALALYKLKTGIQFVTWLQKSHPQILVGVFWLLLISGIGVSVVGLFNVSSTLDLFRADYDSKSMEINSYLGTAASWNSLPPVGASENIHTRYRLAGWKRLMNADIVSDPQNSKQIMMELLYFESTGFLKDFKSFTAEMELPTDIEIMQVYAFLASESGSRSPHEILQTLRTEYPVGVDGNRANLFVTSPDSGEKLEVFVIVHSRHNQPLPKGIESDITLRSIR